MSASYHGGWWCLSYADDVPGSLVLLHGGKVPRSMLQAEESKILNTVGVHARMQVVSQPCDTVQRRRACPASGLRLHAHPFLLMASRELRICGYNAMDVCIGMFGATLLALIRYAGVVDLPGLTLSSSWGVHCCCK